MQELADSATELVRLSIQRAQTCITGFVFLSAADGYGSRAETCRIQLDWQHYRFHRWATIVGLFRNPPELNVPNLVLVARTLQTLERVLSNFNCLHDDYGLTVEVTGEELDHAHTSNALFGDLHTLPNTAATDFVNYTFEAYQKRTDVWKKLRWTKFDPVMFERLLADIDYFNEQLRITLHTWEQDVYDGSSAHTLRALVSQSTRQPVLEVIAKGLETTNEAVSAAARLKQKSLLLHLLEDNLRHISTSPRTEQLTFGSVTVTGEAHAILGNVYHTHTHNHIYNIDSGTSGSNTPSLSGAMPDHDLRSPKFVPSPAPSPVQRTAPIDKNLKKDFKDLRREDAAQGIQHEIAIFRGKQVVVEWKDIPRNMERRLKYRVAAVAELLSSIADPAFHSLRCIGYTREPKSTRFAYIFEVPNNSESSLLTLHELLLIDSLKPSLNQRLTLAIALVETVLQLHTAGWLHKSIRADNVLFFKDNLAVDWNQGLTKPYLGGYEFARLDQPSETTEAPSVHEFARLYRHPLSLAEDRIPFCKAFDLYSVGCVLVEIGLWRSMSAVLHGWAIATDKTKYRLPEQGAGVLPTTATHWHDVVAEKESLLSDIANTSLGSELRFLMGARYVAMVGKCLNAAPMSLGDSFEDDDNVFDASEFSLITQVELVRDLRAMLQGV